MARRLQRLIPLLALTAATTASAGTINGINGGMPNRISMNVTVPKQTQGATFGEKVQSGLHAAGSAVANGASLFVECGSVACAVALPDGSGYLVDLQSLAVRPLASVQGLALRKGTGGAALVGGALPGGSIVSAAVSSVAALAGAGGGAAAASYAATGRTIAPPPLTTRPRADGAIDVVEPLVAGDYALDLEVTRAAPTSARVRMRLVLTASDGTLRTRGDSPMNAISVQGTAK